MAAGLALLTGCVTRAPETPSVAVPVAEVADGALRWIPPGTFLMGTPENFEWDHDPDECPQRKVTLTQGFWLGVHEVRNAEYAKFLAAIREAGGASAWVHPEQPPEPDGQPKSHTPEFWDNPLFNAPNHPVVGGDWWDAYAYAK